MRAASGHEPSPAWWVRGCRRLWHGFLWMWGVLIVGISINVGSAWLTTATFSLTKTPLGWLLDHPALLLAVGGILLALTALTGGVTARHRSISPSRASFTMVQQNRQRFLAKLQSRYSDLLAQSLQGAIQIALTFHSTSAAVQNMTRLRLRQAIQPERDLPAGMSILEVYDQAGGDFLILGAPGAGKTIQLFNLAVALRKRAALDEQHPLPVIINLSTWANRKLPLEEWLSEETAMTYNVPRSPLAHWVQRDQFLPLLDGLDEVPEGDRAACIDAINTFRETHMVPLVVSSRTEEYYTAALRSQLVLPQAVVVQPLDAKQVDNYLKEGGKALAGIRSLLRKDAGLRELVSTPLMLHVVTLAYHGVSVQALPKQGTLEEQRRHIFERYVQRRLEEPQGEVAHGSSQDTRHWLSFLARRMRAHNATVFYLEHLQPDWLPQGHVRDWYERLAVRGAGVIMGVLLGLLVNVLFFGGSSLAEDIWHGCMGGLLGGVISGSGLASFQAKGIPRFFFQNWRALSLPGACTGVLVGGLVAFGYVLWGNPDYPFDWLVLGSGLGVCASVLTTLIVSGKRVMSQAVSPVPHQHWGFRVLPQGLIPDHLRLGAIVGLSVGLSYGLSVGLIDGLGYRSDYVGGLIDGLSYGLDYGLSFGLIGIFLSLLLLGRESTIEIAEIITLSGKCLRRSFTSKHHLSITLRILLLISLLVGGGLGLGVGLSAWLNFGLNTGLSYGVSTMLVVGLSTGLSVSIAYWILFGLWEGVSRDILDDHLRTKPNEGVTHSVRSALLVGLIAGGICFWVSLLHGFLQSELSDWLSGWLNFGLGFESGYGLSDGIIFGCTGALLASLLAGGLASLRHLLLCLQLQHLGVTPRHYVRFLDDAARRILLYKDGGGYRSIHHLFLDYFADLEADPPGASSAGQETGIAQEQTNGVTAAPQSP